MKKIFNILLLLLSFAIVKPIAQTVTIEPKELEFLENLVKKIKSAPGSVVIPTPIETTPPASQFKALLKSQKCIVDKKNVEFTLTGGTGNYEIGYGAFPIVYYQFVGSAYIPLYANWDIVFRDKVSKDQIAVNIVTYGCEDSAIIKINNETGSIDLPPVPDVKPDVVLPNPTPSNDEEFAEIGKTYTVSDKFKLHASSYAGGDLAQYYSIKKDGKLIFESNTVDGWSPPEIYFGNHPIETIIPVEAGNYDFYFKNTTTRGPPNNVIVGLVGSDMNNAYVQYGKGGLEKTMKWQLLKPNEESRFSFYLEDKCKKDAPLGKYAIHATIYENGKVCLNKLITGEGYYNDNGFQRYWEAGLGNEFIEFGKSKLFVIKKKTDYSKNITVRVDVGDQYGQGKFTVVEKNGLDIKPSQVLISPWNISYYKVFNNGSIGYEDSPDYNRY